MHEKKLIPTAIVVVLAVVGWFYPAPEGLERSSVLAETASQVNLERAQQIAGDEDPFRPGDVSAALRDIELREDNGRAGQRITELGDSQLDSVSSAYSNLQGDENKTRRMKLAQRAWRLFVIFATTIILILLNTMPIFTASIVALSLAILTGTLTPTSGYSGFTKDFIILIVVAFSIAIGVTKSGLGQRLAWIIISKFGSSSLGLGYSLILTDMLIAPAFPSNTARSGVLFPVMDAVARGRGSKPEPETRRKLGAFLALNSILGLSLSSGMWMTAMAANPAGAERAGRILKLEITFLTWVKAACVPTLVAFSIVPVILYRVFRPELRSTPEAPKIARDKLAEMGPMSRAEILTAAVFTSLVAAWALSRTLSINSAAIAIAGLAVLMLTRVITLSDIRGSSGPITFVWFAALFTLSTYLDNYGFMLWVGESVAATIAGMSWPMVYVLLMVSYVLIHYFFVSQTAHMIAVMPIFLTVGVTAGVPGLMLALMLLFATNFFSPITPQASSSNAIFVGSGYLSMGEVYRYGGFVTLLNLLIFMTVGTAWLMFVL